MTTYPSGLDLTEEQQTVAGMFHEMLESAQELGWNPSQLAFGVSPDLYYWREYEGVPVYAFYQSPSFTVCLGEIEEVKRIHGEQWRAISCRYQP